MSGKPPKTSSFMDESEGEDEEDLPRSSSAIGTPVPVPGDKDAPVSQQNVVLAETGTAVNGTPKTHLQENADRDATVACLEKFVVDNPNQGWTYKENEGLFKGFIPVVEVISKPPRTTGTTRTELESEQTSRSYIVHTEQLVGEAVGLMQQMLAVSNEKFYVNGDNLDSILDFIRKSGPSASQLLFDPLQNAKLIAKNPDKDVAKIINEEIIKAQTPAPSGPNASSSLAGS